MLEDMVKIAGETVRKERFGLANSNPDHRTFTGDVLFTSQKGNNFSKSIEEKFEDTAQVDGLTVWKSNGARFLLQTCCWTLYRLVLSLLSRLSSQYCKRQKDRFSIIRHSVSEQTMVTFI